MQLTKKHAMAGLALLSTLCGTTADATTQSATTNWVETPLPLTVTGTLKAPTVHWIPNTVTTGTANPTVGVVELHANQTLSTNGGLWLVTGCGAQKYDEPRITFEAAGSNKNATAGSDKFPPVRISVASGHTISETDGVMLIRSGTNDESLTLTSDGTVTVPGAYQGCIAVTFVDEATIDEESE